MTKNTEMTMYDEYAQTPEGSRELAAAQLANKVGGLLRSAFDRSGWSSREFARALGVSDGRASQILNSDGNLRVSTIAKALDALGWAASITAEKDGSVLPAPRHSRSRVPAKKTADWTSTQSCTYEVRMMSTTGVGTHSFHIQHDEDTDPVMLETPRLVGSSRSTFHMETTIETETAPRLAPAVHRVKS